MKAIKIVGAGIGLVILLAVLVVVAFIATFDANAYKQELAQIVKQQTGRELRFDGDISLTLYPALGMDLGRMSFANAPGFGAAPMLTVNRARISVDVLSILALTPEVARLTLDGLNVNLQRNAQGTTNFDDLIATTESTPEIEPDPVPREEGTPQDVPPLKGGSFGGLEITNASLAWRDAVTGDSYEITDLNIESGRIELDRSFPLTFSLDLNNGSQLRASLVGSTRASLGKERVSLSALQLSAEASGEMIPVDKATVRVSGDIGYRLDDGQLAVKGFAAGLDSQGGVLQRASIRLAGEIGFDNSSQRLDIGALDLQADLTDPSLPAGAMRAGMSAATTQIRLAENAVQLDDLQLVIGEDRFKGWIKVKDYLRPDLSFELSAPLLDVDKLLGDTAQAPAGPAPEPTADSSELEIKLPMEQLRALRLDGSIKIQQLKVSKLALRDVLLKVHADQGVIDLKPIALNLYDGSLQGSMQVDARGQQPRYQVSQQLKGFQIGSFLQDFIGEQPISGQTDLAISLSSQGELLSQLERALDGDLRLAVSDGALQGFNLRHKLDVARAKLRGQAEPELQARKTDFSALSLSGKVAQGVFSTDDLNLQAPLLRVGGRGSADLVEQTVNYLVNAKLVGTTKGQQGGGADDLSGVPIPVAITGPWLHPDIDVQLDEMLKARLDAEKARIRDQVAKEKAELEARLAEEKAKLKEAQDRKIAAEKERLQKERDLAIAEEKAKLDAKKQAEEERARDKLKEKLQKLF